MSKDPVQLMHNEILNRVYHRYQQFSWNSNWNTVLPERSSFIMGSSTLSGSSASDCRWLYLSQMHWIHLEKNWSTIIKRPTPGFPGLWSWNERVSVKKQNGKLPCLSKCFNITLILLVKMNDTKSVIDASKFFLPWLIVSIVSTFWTPVFSKFPLWW